MQHLEPGLPANGQTPRQSAPAGKLLSFGLFPYVNGELFAERVEYLFALYEQLTAPLVAAAKPARKSRKI